MLKKLWATISGEAVSETINIDNATAEKLVRLLKNCPACRNDFSDHHYSMLAKTVYSEQNKQQVAQFIQAFKEHNWVVAMAFQDWEALENALEAYAIRCKFGGIAVLLIHSPYEVFEDDSVFSVEVLSPEESELFLSENSLLRLAPL